jgi:hypothetical protein
MMDHDALAQGCLSLGDTGAALGNHAARLVTGDEIGLSALVGAQIAAAHAGGAHGDHHFARARFGIWKLSKLDLLISQKDEATHTRSA